MKTILAAIDFSAVSDRVLSTIEELAGASASRVLLLHVVQIPATLFAFPPAGEEFPGVVAGMEREAQGRLDRLRSSLPHLAVETLTAAGSPSEEILREARDAAADIIVVGSHGHTALYEFLLGGTARAVLAKAHCPVVVVPSINSAADAAADAHAEAGPVSRLATGK